MTDISATINNFEEATRGVRYLSRCRMSPTTDEWVVTAIDLDRGTGSAERRTADCMCPAETQHTLLYLFQECCAELDDRRAHADTAPQPSTLDAAADFDPIQASYDSFRLDVAKAVVEAAKLRPTKKPSDEPMTISAAEIAQAFFGPSLPGWSRQGFVVGYDPGSPDGDIGVVEIMRRDPLDVEYDYVPLRRLVMFDEMYRREEVPSSPRHVFTPAQRSAISAHWSAQLRAKVDATKQTERAQVVCERDDDGE